MFFLVFEAKFRNHEFTGFTLIECIALQTSTALSMAEIGAPYLGNSARQDVSYYYSLTGSCIRTFDVTVNDLEPHIGRSLDHFTQSSSFQSQITSNEVRPTVSATKM